MNKKCQTFYSVCALLVGVFGGAIGTAFSMGQDKQRINDILTTHTAQMISMKENEDDHKKATQKELDRFADIIAAQITLVQGNITYLGNTIGDLRTDVSVLKAIMERVENDLEKKRNSS